MGADTPVGGRNIIAGNRRSAGDADNLVFVKLFLGYRMPGKFSPLFLYAG